MVRMHVLKQGAVVSNNVAQQESPHEHQQNLLLSRIITNVVSPTPYQQSVHRVADVDMFL